MSKKQVERLIKLASRPVESEQERQRRLAGYSGRQTRSRKLVDTSAKRRGKSLPSKERFN